MIFGTRLHRVPKRVNNKLYQQVTNSIFLILFCTY